MNDIEKRLDDKLNYLYGMAHKYNDLNYKTKGKYKWREEAICEQIEVLEELKMNESINTFDECYEEDLKSN